MAKWCPEIKHNVTYLSCLECESKSCRRNTYMDNTYENTISKLSEKEQKCMTDVNRIILNQVEMDRL